MSVLGEFTKVRDAFPEETASAFIQHNIRTLADLKEVTPDQIKEMVGKSCGPVRVERILLTLVDAKIWTRRDFEIWQVKTGRFPYIRSVSPEEAHKKTYVWYVFHRALVLKLLLRDIYTLGQLTKLTEPELKHLGFSEYQIIDLRATLRRAGVAAPKKMSECRGAPTWWKKIEDAPRNVWVLTWSEKGGMNVAALVARDNKPPTWYVEPSDEPVELAWAPTHFAFLPPTPKFRHTANARSQ